MNADALEIILNNTSADIARDVRGRVHDALNPAGQLPGQPDHQEQPGSGACMAVGEIVKAMVLEYADREHNGIDSGAGLTSTTLDHVNWAEVGRYYYVTAEA